MNPLAPRTLPRVLIAASTAWLLMAGVAQASVMLDLLTDDFGSETSFELVDVTAPGTNIAYDSFSSSTDGPPNAFLDDGFADVLDLLANTDYLFNWDLPTGDYEFSIFDSFGDGICCLEGFGNYSLDVQGTVFPSPTGGAFGFEETIEFSVEKEPSVAVPEPTAALLFMAGLGVVGQRRRRYDS